MERISSRKIYKLLLICIVLLNNNTQAQQTNQFSVKQALDYGLKNAYQVKNALLDVLIQEQTNKEITSGAYPQITGSGAFTDYINIPTSLLPAEVFGGPAGTFVPLKFGTKYSTNAGISLSQVLFDGQIFVGLQARKTSIAARQKVAEVTQENIKTNIYKIYYQLVVSKTQIDLLNANLARLEKLGHDTKEIYKNGFAEKLDVDKVTVQIANLQTEKLQALNSIANGYAGLKVLIGMPLKDSIILTDSLNDTQVKENILTAAEYQYTDRKEYQALVLNNKLNEYNIKRYKLSRIPVLSFNANYIKQAQLTKFNFFKKQTGTNPKSFRLTEV